MKKKALVTMPSNSNYGVLTDISKEINFALGDRTGRTVSMRTAEGFKNTFELDDMSADAAEHIVHAGMISSAVLLSSENNGAKVGGFLLLLGLIACYQQGA